VNLLQYLAQNWSPLGPEMRTHVQIVTISMIIAAAIGVTLSVASTLLAIPSFALFGVRAIALGIGNRPVEIGLILYALLPILRNMMAGVRGVAHGQVTGRELDSFCALVAAPAEHTYLVAGIPQQRDDEASERACTARHQNGRRACLPLRLRRLVVAGLVRRGVVHPIFHHISLSHQSRFAGHTYVDPAQRKDVTDGGERLAGGTLRGAPGPSAGSGLPDVGNTFRGLGPKPAQEPAAAG
jgi:hypothetical protein